MGGAITPLPAAEAPPKKPDASDVGAGIAPCLVVGEVVVAALVADAAAAAVAAAAAALAATAVAVAAAATAVAAAAAAAAFGVAPPPPVVVVVIPAVGDVGVAIVVAAATAVIVVGRTRATLRVFDKTICSCDSFCLCSAASSDCRRLPIVSNSIVLDMLLSLSLSFSILSADPLLLLLFFPLLLCHLFLVKFDFP